MKIGEVVAGQFELCELTATGGMGEVFRGHDLITGETVAVKVLKNTSHAGDRGRFAREAKILAGLHHPHVVRYIAHGEAPSGDPYLVMEWLSGEHLGARLERGSLTIKETLTLGVRVAEALAAAHAVGLVHRDLKPGNLFLVDGAVSAVKVLDFGIAWRKDATRMTSTGALIGTPAYMAPEQARTGEGLDARTDVFTLGCVLYECITGVRTFTGEHVMAVLAKVLFHEAPPLRERCPDAPPALAAVLDGMLAKDPSKRPADGAAVAIALSALGEGGSTPRDDDSALAPIAAITGEERRVLSVVLVGAARPLSLGTTQLSSGAVGSPKDAALREAVEARGGRFEPLSDGSAVVTLAGVGIPTDQAAQAARCALALREIDADRPMALATGRGKVRGRLPAGDVIDRSADLLVDPDAGGGIGIDTMTAGLLEGRFEMSDRGGRIQLWGELEEGDGTRTLLGKPTSCLGRDRELGTLLAIFTECVDEPVARAVLVTAPAGVGKSRLAYELVRQIRRRPDAVEIWIGRGEALQAGSSLGLVGQVIRAVCELREGDSRAMAEEKIRARVARHVAPPRRRQIAEILGELAIASAAGDELSARRGAREDHEIPAEHVQKAWEDFLLAETAAQPVLLVLDGLHWGDRSSVRLIGGALRELRERPFMVLALARPEVHELFPNLWDGRNLQELRLGELTRRASERLVGQALGHRATPTTTERIASMADGNAFYLEELIRAAAEGRGEGLPETVLAMVEARVAGLEPEARRVLRAASVFGQVCWQGGVIALLGSAFRSTRAGEWLSTLVNREMLVRRHESRFPGEPEFAFRHALLREGAYAMLTEEDQILGHHLAGEWLLQNGETDLLAIADHFDRGKDASTAATHYLRAATQALEKKDRRGAIARAQRGLACGVRDDATRAALAAVLSEADPSRR